MGRKDIAIHGCGEAKMTRLKAEGTTPYSTPSRGLLPRVVSLLRASLCGGAVPIV